MLTLLLYEDILWEINVFQIDYFVGLGKNP